MTNSSQYEIDNLNTPKTIKEIEFIILKLPRRSYLSPSSDDFPRKFYEKFKVKLSTLYIFPERRGQNISKPDTDNIKN